MEHKWYVSFPVPAGVLRGMLTRQHKAITRKKVTAIYMGKRNLSQLNRGIHNSCGSNRLIIDDNLSEAQSIEGLNGVGAFTVNG